MAGVMPVARSTVAATLDKKNPVADAVTGFF
jgi:hypothetical protein